MQYDGLLTIATGSSRRCTNWKNKRILWSDLAAKLSNVTRTQETQAEYPRITVYHNSCCHCVVTKIGWCGIKLYRYYSAVLFELQYHFSKFTRNIFKKRAKHIDF